jgi:hypothetical protein
VVLEDQVVLGPAHSPHDIVRRVGKGAYFTLGRSVL